VHLVWGKGGFVPTSSEKADQRPRSTKREGVKAICSAVGGAEKKEKYESRTAWLFNAAVARGERRGWATPLIWHRGEKSNKGIHHLLTPGAQEKKKM